MTRERIAEGLSTLVLALANGHADATPEGWTPHEWAYVKGIASGALLRVHDQLVSPGTGFVDQS